MTRPSLAMLTIGAEKASVAVVDNFAPDPAYLRRFAETAAFAAGDLYYPGLKAPLPAGYFEAVNPVIAAVMVDVFGFTKGADVLRASYAIVTTPPDRLSIEQRLPHVDSLEAGRMAIVHYLSTDDGDGTSFYRHRATGFETLSEKRSPAYFNSLNAELRQYGEPAAAYMNGDTPLFEQIGHVGARYNRAAIYRGDALHSGAISADASLSPSPRDGRLTIASFLAGA